MNMANHTAESAVTIPLKDLEKLIRRAVHDEITKLIQRQPAIFYLDPQTPIYEDLANIARLKKRGKAKVYSRQEAFGG
jgi:hypothetical protein